ncbi:MAG TPA: energy transducer TonB [Blastocatellia bacterium]|nr:energy transducer TonB [Blastocatellia bacterium]
MKRETMSGRLTTGRRSSAARRWAGLAALAVAAALAGPAPGQLLRKGDYGAGLTVSVYQFDDTRSRAFEPVTTLKQTVSSPQEEIDLITRTYGVEEMKSRHVRSIGLREGESFTDSPTFNERPLVITITPEEVTKEEVKFNLVARYAEETLLEARNVRVGNYETVMLRGARGDFGVREFMGPNGVERIPEKRALLITVTPSVIQVSGLQNKPSEISRPTDQFGSKVGLGASDIFVMPTVVNRVAPKFVAGSQPKGTITLEGVVTPEGRATNVRVLDTPDPAFNAKAIDAFRQYRFNPATLNGRPTYATFRETIVFSKPGPL